MALILLIETSTANCSAALARDGEVIIEKSSDAGYVHAEKLAVFIQDCLKEASITSDQLNAIAVSNGPGSYTGLRVGLSTAKGLAYGLGIPLLVLPTLEVMIAATQAAHPDGVAYLSAIDARRKEVYLQMSRQGEYRGPEPVVLDTTDWETWISSADGPVWVSGDGAEKVLDHWLIPHLQDSGIRCLASQMARMAEAKFSRSDWADLAYVEPAYLKPPGVTVPKSVFPGDVSG